jgi:acyl carrier protein
MDKSEVMQKLQGIFQEVFDDTSITINENTTADDIEDWDSLEHITLVGAVEKAFGMRFKMKEVSSMKNVGEMADIILKRV